MSFHIREKKLTHLFVLLISLFFSCTSQQKEKLNDEDTNVYNYSLSKEDIQDSIAALPKSTLDRIKTIVNRISLDSTVYISDIEGYAGHPTIQYEYANHLLGIASSSQLKRIAIKHSSVVVRAAVFNALLRKDASAAVDVSIAGINDTTYVNTIRVDLEDCEHLNELRINTLLINKDYYNISDDDYDRLDSAVLFSKKVKKLDAYGNLYSGMKPKSQYYKRLNSLYNDENYTGPIVALIKYNNEESKDMLTDLLDLEGTRCSINLCNALEAISLCPDTRYKSYVQKIANSFLKHKKNFPEQLYSALMAYEEQWTLALIDSSMKNYSSEWDLYYAYKKHPRSYYKAVYDRYCSRYAK